MSKFIGGFGIPEAAAAGTAATAGEAILALGGGVAGQTAAAAAMPGLFASSAGLLGLAQDALPWLKVAGDVMGGFGEAGAARQNAQYARLQGELAREEGRDRARAIRRQGTQINALQQVGYAKSGVDGLTPLLVQAESDRETAMDAALAEYQGQMRGGYHEAAAQQFGKRAASSLLGIPMAVAGRMAGSSQAKSLLGLG